MFEDQNGYQFNFHHFNSQNEPPKKSGSGFLKTFLTVVLCVSLSFCAGIGGVIYGKRNLLPAETDTPNVIPAPSIDSVHNSNPEDLLNREDIEYSPYGSAGEDAYAISEVVRMVQDSVVVINAKVLVSNGWYGTSESTSA